MLQSATVKWQGIKDTELLAQLATDAALSANWQEAAKINQKILRTKNDNVEALNKLARALTFLGEPQKAQKIYKKVLALDAYNIIARKNLEKITESNGTNGHQNNATLTPTLNLPSLFVFEPGKTKIINLLNVAQPSTLVVLVPGEEVVINAKNHAVTITKSDGTYLGALPDDLAHRLISFIAGGNKYQAYVKNASAKTLVIFIREVYRSEKFTNQPSFQANFRYLREEFSV